LNGGEGAGKGRGSEYWARSFAFRAARLVPLDFVDECASTGVGLKKENIVMDEANRLFEGSSYLTFDQFCRSPVHGSPGP